MTSAPTAHADRADHAEDVPLCGRGAWPEHEVRCGQCIEVRDVAVHVVRGVEQLTELHRRLLGGGFEHAVQCLGGAQVVRSGAYAAKPGGDLVQLVDRPADAELLEAPQLGHLPVGVGDVPLVVQEDLDLAVAFQAW